MRKLIATLLILALAGSVTSASAQSNNERTYQIEVIVFSHITAQGLQSEQWPWTPTNFVAARNAINVSALPKNYFILAPEERLLNKNDRYHVILHLAWRQRISTPRKAQPVHVFGGNIYSSSGSLIGKAEYGQQDYSARDVWQVNGTITPSLVRYIDLKFNLLFAQPLSSLPGANEYNNVQGRFAYFRLQQTRRLRSRELNYIGHPLYGVLVKVVPVG